jgi:glycosyltransferase involved in cell wall biosynthesis
MTDRLRIAFIGLRGVPAGEGGIERHVEELGARLAERGHEVTVYTRSNYVETRVPEYRGMRVRYVASAGTKHLDFIAHSAVSSVLVLRRAPDIVHYHAVASGLVAPIPRYLSRSKVVLTVHGLDYDRAKWGRAARVALKLGARLSARVPHATITVSQALADHFAANLGRVATYIPNGIPEAHLEPLGDLAARFGIERGRYFLFVGRLVPEKAPDLLLSAFAKVDADARLVIAGGSGFTDDYTERLRRAAASDPRVLMPGPVFGSELSALYTNAAAFVLPSSLEGLPITLLEAIGHRSPVIVSDIAPHVEVVGQDGPGRRVVAQGDEAALAAAMARVLAEGDEERAAAELLSSQVAARYNWDAAADATERIYLRLLDREPSLAATPPVEWPLDAAASESVSTAARSSDRGEIARRRR